MSNFSHFSAVLDRFSWDGVGERIYCASTDAVERALTRIGSMDLEDFAALVSPAAMPYLEKMAILSQRLTRRRFGNVIQLYIPLYLSNQCHNVCTYCGFSVHNKIPRRTLDLSQVLEEVKIVKSYGYDHVLLLTGEAHRQVGVDYFEQVLKCLRLHFAHIAMEVQPLEQQDYQRLRSQGLDAVFIYQETYHRARYGHYHPKGKKSDFYYRLETPDRLGRAGIHKMGIGALLGLEDWRIDAWFTALHLDYLRRVYWRTKYSISFPRLRPAEGYNQASGGMNERELLQLICAYRLFDVDVELSLSTRERAEFRDNVMALGITSMSAGSQTEPGGYTQPAQALEQFSIADQRSPAEVAAAIRKQGLEPVWKDWDAVFGQS